MPLTPPAKKNLWILILAHAFLGSQMPIIFTIGGLAGQSLAANICWATLPISMTIIGSVIAATPMSNFMQKHGRRAGFWVGTFGGGLGAVICAFALVQNSFGLFLLGSLFTGVYRSANGYFRFAAADGVDADFRPKAISYVLAGGLAAAVIGPQLVKLSAEAMVVPFLGAYLVVVLINIIGSGLFVFLDMPPPKETKETAKPARSYGEILRTPAIAVSIICGMVSYSLMNLVMTATPLAVVGCGFSTNHVADIVTAHVLAMFVPSFFTGHLITRFGSRNIVAVGLLILGSAGAVALMGVELMNFYGALILLGIGWNFGFIGATAMLTESHPVHERGRVQGINELIVMGFVSIASVTSGLMLNCTGTDIFGGWTYVNLLMLPLLALAGLALIWISKQPKQPIQS